MKNRLAYLILGIFAAAFTSCVSSFEEAPTTKYHTVYFTSAENGAGTKTGITIEDRLVTPDWRKTQPANVHLYETDAEGGISIGEDVEITLSDDNLTASFKTDFPMEWTIIVDPAMTLAKGAGTRSAGNAPYTYSAVVAQQAADGAFIVPSVQYPDAETLIDPDADFLIGYSRKSYADPHDYEEAVVDLYFDRPVSLSRISLSNFAGESEKVKSVTVRAESGLTGSATLADVDFASATVSFTAADESGELVLSYPDGTDVLEDGTFQAYFVSLPGQVTVTSLEVLTDQYRYTKTIEGGKEFTFSSASFKNINLDLSTAVREEVVPESVTWYKASVLEDGIGYLVVSNGNAMTVDGTTLGVFAVTEEEGVIVLDPTDEVAVFEAAAHVELYDEDDETAVAGHFTLSYGGQYLQRSSDSSTQVGAIGGIPDKVKYYVWEYDGEHLYHLSSSSYTFYLGYDDGWVFVYKETYPNTYLYTSRPPQELSFSETNVVYDLDSDEPFTAPELSGALTDVTYSSSNETVATVDASTGAVTLLKTGTVVITAVAAGNDAYQAGSASYTVVVTNSHVDTFYLASEILAGDSYLIVSNGYAMTVDGSTLGTLAVTENEGTIQIAASEVALFEAAAHVEYYSGTSAAGHFTLSYGGQYLQRSSDSSTQVGAIGGIPETAKYYVWEYDGEHLYHLSSASYTFYLGYDDGWVFVYKETYPNTYLYSTTPQKKAQRLSFSSESVYAVLGEPFTAPTLSGAKTTVTWSSSDETVATVDQDGNVTPVALGTATITASAVADDEYNAGSASYELTVTDGSVPTWYKVEEIEDGETYLIVSNGYALQNNDGSTAGVAVDVNDGVIVYDAPETVIWTATSSSSKFTFKNSGKYLYRGSSSVSISSSPSTWSYNSDSEYLTTGSSTTYYLYYSTSQSKWSSSSSSSSHTAAVYSRTAPRAAQTLSFSEASVSYDLAGEDPFTAPTLSGAETTVTYASSKTAVATVDAGTGEVTIVGVGTTTITASAEETDEYKAATASYTIRVTDSSLPVTTNRYVLASELEAGKNYLIVSGGYALKNNDGTAEAVAVEPVDDVIEFEPGEDDALVWTAAAESSLPDYGDFTLNNDGKYIRRPGSGGTSLTLEAASSFTKYFVWLYDGTHLYHNNLVGSSSSTQYIYWMYYDDSGSWKFVNKATTDPNHESAKVTQLYVEE